MSILNAFKDYFRDVVIEPVRGQASGYDDSGRFVSGTPDPVSIPCRMAVLPARRSDLKFVDHGEGLVDPKNCYQEGAPLAKMGDAIVLLKSDGNGNMIAGDRFRVIGIEDQSQTPESSGGGFVVYAAERWRDI